MMGNKVTENSAGEQPRLQLININKNKKIKTPNVVNILMINPSQQNLMPTTFMVLNGIQEFSIKATFPD